MTQSLFTVFADRQTKLSLGKEQTEDILSFRKVLGQNWLSVSYDGYLQVSNYVGFISKGKTRLQILPKIHEDTGFTEVEEELDSMRAVLALLRISGFDKIQILPEQSSYAEKADLMEVFISLFARMIWQTYSRQMNREYRSIYKNSPFVRGKIYFSLDIRKNPVRQDLHFVKLQSFDHNNLINNVIKTVATGLFKRTTSPENKKLLQKALFLLDEAQLILLTKEVFNTAIFTRLNQAFKPVFEMAKIFFHNLTPYSYHGDDAIFSFLVPLNKLFENYVYKLFLKLFGENAVSYHNSRRFARGNESHFQARIRPDIVLFAENKPLFIADAKYKNPKYQDGSYRNINQADLYQIYSYARVYGIDSVALVYPQFSTDATPPIQLELGQGAEKVDLTLGCLNIKDPDLTKGSKALAGILAIAGCSRLLPAPAE